MIKKRFRRHLLRISLTQNSFVIMIGELGIGESLKCEVYFDEMC